MRIHCSLHTRGTLNRQLSHLNRQPSNVQHHCFFVLSIPLCIKYSYNLKKNFLVQKTTIWLVCIKMEFILLVRYVSWDALSCVIFFLLFLFSFLQLIFPHFLILHIYIYTSYKLLLSSLTDTEKSTDESDNLNKQVIYCNIMLKSHIVLIHILI